MFGKIAKSRKREQLSGAGILRITVWFLIPSSRGGPLAGLRPISGRDPLRFNVLFRFFVFTFGHQLGFGGFPGFGPEAFRFSFSRFYSFCSFSPFDAIWPARQGRLPGTLEPGAYYRNYRTGISGGSLRPAPPPPYPPPGGVRTPYTPYLLL